MKRVTTVGVALLFGAAAFGQDLSWKSSELAPGLYMLEGQGGFTGGNLGLLTGDDGVVLIDNGVPNISATTVAAIEKLTGAPVSFVINTHAHGDHTGANVTLAGKGATVVAHDNLRRALVNDGFDAAGLPQLTFDNTVTIHLNGHTAEIEHIASAHTDGDAFIYFPEANVLHTGDAMFNYLFPFIDLDGGGSVDGFIAAQQRMLAVANDTTRIIPGHGPLASKADLQVALNMLIDAKNRVQVLVDQGMSQDEVLADNPLADYGETWSWGFISTEVMTQTLYRALSSE